MKIFEWAALDKKAPRLLALARALLLAAIVASALYQMQHYFSFPFSATGRLVLFIGVIVLLLSTGPSVILLIPKLFWFLGLTVVLAGVHTFFLYGTELALAATTRFANVMVIAPIAALLFISPSDMRRVFTAYLVVLSAALISMLYQYLGGGSIDAIVGDYVAIRADLVRYMTVVGEPNVGGVIAVLGFIIAIVIPRRTLGSVAMAGFSVTFVIMTLSKAAILGLGLAGVMMLAAASRGNRLKALIRMALSGVVGLLLLFLVGADDYLSASFRSVFGQISGEPSAMSDFVNRQVEFGYGLDSVTKQVFGSSFGIAGSAAQEVLGLDVGVFLPHNSYLELYLTGGLAMLGCTIALMVSALRRIVADARRYRRAEDHCALVSLVILSCLMLVYPVIYEPATGAFFWSIIGYGAMTESGVWAV